MRVEVVLFELPRLFFQYSIGDAGFRTYSRSQSAYPRWAFNTPLEMPFVPAFVHGAMAGAVFQYSIGDAELVVDPERGPPIALSILHWRCTIGVGNTCLCCENTDLSILHWRCETMRAAGLSRVSRHFFQYSIGDASC